MFGGDRRNSPVSGLLPVLRVPRRDILRGEVSHTTKLQLGGALEKGLPRYTPRHWVARDLGSPTSRTRNNCEPMSRSIIYIVQ